jgi:hypothetical protein
MMDPTDYAGDRRQAVGESRIGATLPRELGFRILRMTHAMEMADYLASRARVIQRFFRGLLGRRERTRLQLQQMDDYLANLMRQMGPTTY